MHYIARFVGGGLLGVAMATGSMAPVQAAAPVLVKNCTVAKPKPFSHRANGTDITYVIYGNKTASAVTFLVGYRNALHNYARRTTDVGSFSPGVTISHRLSLYNDVTYAGSMTTMCVPVSVRWSDATLWVAPSHP
jgi:hypothetical protein